MNPVSSSSSCNSYQYSAILMASIPSLLHHCSPLSLFYCKKNSHRGSAQILSQLSDFSALSCSGRECSGTVRSQLQTQAFLRAPH